jgi:hypothetical protein
MAEKLSCQYLVYFIRVSAYVLDVAGKKPCEKRRKTRSFQRKRDKTVYFF